MLKGLSLPDWPCPGFHKVLTTLRYKNIIAIRGIRYRIKLLATVTQKPVFSDQSGTHEDRSQNTSFRIKLIMDAGKVQGQGIITNLFYTRENVSLIKKRNC